MAKCRRCGKGGLFGKVDSRGFCAACAAEVAEMERRAAQQREEDERKRREAAQRDAEAERERREAWLAQTAEIERERQLREKAELAKPFEAPEYTDGFCLAYSYREVGFFAPDDLLSSARNVPPRKQLRMVLEPDNQFDKDAVALYYEDSNMKESTKEIVFKYESEVSVFGRVTRKNQAMLNNSMGLIGNLNRATGSMWVALLESLQLVPGQNYTVIDPMAIYVE